MWSVSDSAHQTEDTNVASDIWMIENRPTPDRSGDACDSYQRWEKDLDIIAARGLTLNRFSIAWARIEPVLSAAVEFWTVVAVEK